jgi:regulator of protease activity HflC (stomatin/prohibitin superfamily)
MDAFLLGVTIGLGLVALFVLVTSPFWVLAAITWLAKRNLFFTYVEEGQAKAILRNGQFRRLVMSYRGFEFDKDWNVVEDTGSGGTTGFWKFLGGVRWLGLPGVDTVYTYKFRWSTPRDKEVDGKVTGAAFHEEKEIDYILVKDYVYYSLVEEAETNEKVQVSVEVLLPIRIVNPYNALFRVHKWLDATLELVKPAIRAWIAARSYADVIQKPEATQKEQDNFLTETGIAEYVEKRFGARTKRLAFRNISPVGPMAQKVLEGSMKEYQARRDQEAINVNRDAEVNRFKAIADAVNTTPSGEFVFAGETLRQAAKDPASKIVLVGSAEGLIRGLMGKEK